MGVARCQFRDRAGGERADEREELSLLVTWAIALGIEGVLSVVYHTTYRSTLTSYANKSLTIAGYHISVVRLMAFAVSGIILLGLYLLLSRTSLGRSIRATVQNPTSARLLGIDAARVSALVQQAALVRDKAKAVYEEAVKKTGQPLEVLAGPAVFEPSGDRDELVRQAQDLSIAKRREQLGEDVAGLQELIKRPQLLHDLKRELELLKKSPWLEYPYSTDTR